MQHLFTFFTEFTEYRNASARFHYRLLPNSYDFQLCFPALLQKCGGTVSTFFLWWLAFALLTASLMRNSRQSWYACRWIMTDPVRGKIIEMNSILTSHDSPGLQHQHEWPCTLQWRRSVSRKRRKHGPCCSQLPKDVDGKLGLMLSDVVIFLMD